LTPSEGRSCFAIIAERGKAVSMEAANRATGASMSGGSQEHLWMVVLYEVEERTSELLDRLAALGIDTSEASIVRVELSQVAEAAKAFGAVAKPPPKSVSPRARNAVTGAVLGSAVGLLGGIALYASGLFHLTFAAGLFPHSVVAAVFGATAGSVIGTSWSALRKKKELRSVATIPPSNRDGFLVAVKMKPQVAEQAEEIARRLGAKEVLI